jgi:hypothetical protein
VTIPPDTKDWTWVLDQPCTECGFDARTVDVEDLPQRITANAAAWQEALAADDAAVRQEPTRWSTLEYGCHVRDVHLVFTERVRAMLAEDDPQFANWDQDETAAEGDYGRQDPATVADELRSAAERAAEQFAAVTGEQWQRPGRRSNGSVFTVDSIARYYLHDIEHHRWDVTGRRAG